MNEYEIMLLLDPELAEERANEILQRLRDAVEGVGGEEERRAEQARVGGVEMDGQRPARGEGDGAVAGAAVEGAGGTWDGHEPWGRRRLAYEIAKKGEAVYHLLLFTCPAETLDEITRVLKITDGVLRHGAYRRVKGSVHQKAPAQAPAPAPAAAPSGSADDSDTASE